MSGGHVVEVEAAFRLILDRLGPKGPSLFSLWFNAAIKLARLYQSELAGMREGDLDLLITAMNTSCQASDGSDDILYKGSQLLELFAIEMQRIAESQPIDMLKRLKVLMGRCARANSAVSNPRSMAVIREHAGKILMGDMRYADAYNEFFEAFKSFSDTGNPRAKTVLKYAVLANMFALSDINPFDSREARAFQFEPEVLVIVRLREAYDRKDLDGLEAIIGDPNFPSLIDPWIESVIPKLVDRIKLQYLEAVLPVYRTVKIDKLAKILNLDRHSVQRMTMRLILDGRLSASISNDQVEVGLAENESPEIAALEVATELIAQHSAGLQDTFRRGSTVRTR